MSTTVLEDQVSTLTPPPRISLEECNVRVKIIRSEVAGRKTRKEAETRNMMRLKPGRAGQMLWEGHAGEVIEA